MAAPADADLVLQIGYSDALTGVGGSSESGPVSFNASQISLVLLDLKTHIILWTINEQTSIGHAQKGRDQALVASINALVGDLKALTAPPPAVSATK